jgi:hypothetical protein
MVLANARTEFRSMLAEAIPPGGSPDDTLFTDDRLDELIIGANNDLERAAYDGWREKAGILANLVTVTEGAASRSMTDLQAQAIEMVKLYAKASSGPTEGRARIGRIVRR